MAKWLCPLLAALWLGCSCFLPVCNIHAQVFYVIQDGATFTSTSGSISLIRAGGSVSTFASGASGSHGVAYNPATGDLFMTDYGTDGNVYKITSGGSISVFRSETVGDNLSGVAVDAGGKGTNT